MSKIRLVERITERTISRDNLPEGVLARVTYPVMRIGVKNANKRVYGKDVAEAILNDPTIQEKLKTRTLFGNQEHPTESALKLNKDETSHIVSNIYLDEAKGILYQDIDVLPTEAGKFIDVLLGAGCQVGVSTRAEGELQEAIEETSGEKYFKVVAESYCYISTDFTADPSTPDALPENLQRNVMSITRQKYEAKQITAQTAVALLERISTKESKKLCESIKDEILAIQKDTKKIKDIAKEISELPDIKIEDSEEDKDKKAAKKMTANLTNSFENKIKPNDTVSVNHRIGSVVQTFEKTGKAIISFGTEKISNLISECKKFIFNGSALNEDYKAMNDGDLLTWLKTEEEKPVVNKVLVDLLALELKARGLNDKKVPLEIKEGIEIAKFVSTNSTDKLKTSSEKAKELGLYLIPTNNVPEDHAKISAKLKELHNEGYSHLAWSTTPEDLKNDVKKVNFYGIKPPAKFKWKEATLSDLENWIAYFKKIGALAAARGLTNQKKYLQEVKTKLSEATTVKNIRFEVEEDHEYIPYEAKVEINYDVDKNYGADADNNRGITTTFIRDVKILELTKEGISVDPIEITKKIEKAINDAVEDLYLSESKKLNEEGEDVELYSDEYNDLVLQKIGALSNTTFSLPQALEVAKTVASDIDESPEDIDEDYVSELLLKQVEKGNLTTSEDGLFTWAEGKIPTKKEVKAQVWKTNADLEKPQTIEYKGYKIQVAQDATRNFRIQIGTDDELKAGTSFPVGYAGNAIRKFDDAGNQVGKVTVEEMIQKAKDWIDLFADGSVNALQAAFDAAKNKGASTDYIKKVAKNRKIALSGLEGKQKFIFVMAGGKLITKEGTKKDLDTWIEQLGEDNIEQIEDSETNIIWPPDKKPVTELSDSALKAEYELLKKKAKVNKSEVLRQNELLDELDARNIVVESKITKVNSMKKTIKESTVLGVDFGSKVNVEKADVKQLDPEDKTDVKVQELTKQVEDLLKQIEDIKFSKQKAKETSERLVALQKAYQKDVLRLTESQNEMRKLVNSSVKKLQESKASIIVLKELVEESKKKLNESNVLKVEEVKKVSSLNETKLISLTEKHNKEISELKAAHTSELVMEYGKALLEARGLTLTPNLQTLFEACKTKEEIRGFIREAVNLLREGIINSAPLKEVVITKQVDEKQEKLKETVGLAFKSMR